LSFSSPTSLPDLEDVFLDPSILRAVYKVGVNSIVLDVRESIILDKVSVGLPFEECIESKVFSCGVKLLYTALKAS
jgi:hypothetical protein